MKFISQQSFLLSLWTKFVPTGVLALSALFACAQSQAFTVDFTLAEGYSSTESALDGQPDGDSDWSAHASWDVDGTTGLVTSNRGYSSNSLAAVYQTALAKSEGSSISVSATFQFAGLGATTASNQYVYSIGLSTDSDSSTAFSSNFAKVILGRLANSSKYVLYFSTNSNGYAGAVTFTASSIGDDGTTDDLTDNLEISLTMTEGSSASDWTVEISLTNLDTETVVATSTISSASTNEAFYSSSELYALFASLSSASNGGTSELTVDSFSVNIPEPHTSVMIGAVVLALACLARRRLG